MTAIEDIKARVDCRAYIANDLGAPTSRSNGVWFFRCPLGTHTDSTGSFAVYPDNHWHCYGCNQTGDVLNYISARTGMSAMEAVNFLNGDSNLPKYKPAPAAAEAPEKPFTMTLNQVLDYRRNLSLVDEYLKSRNITSSVVDTNLLGCEVHRRSYTDLSGKVWNFDVPYVTIPYLFHENVYSFNSRRNDLYCRQYLQRLGEKNIEFLRSDVAKKSDKLTTEISDRHLMDRCFGSRFYRPGSPVTAYGVGKLVYKRGESLVYPYRPYCILTEGEANEWSAECEGFLCIALKPVERVNLRRLLQNVRMVLIAVDPDDAGTKYAQDILKLLGNDLAKARTMIMPQGFGDLNELRKAEMLGSYLSRKPFYLDPVNWSYGS